jgi:CRISPR/Cas system-associated exonuclease Cas4 (RecB family)
MAFYKLLMDTSPDWDGEVTKWGWYYPASNHIYLEDVNTRSENAMLKSIADLIYAYELDEFEPSYFHKKCVWCSYQDLCPAAIDAALNYNADSNKVEGWF